MFTYQSFLCHQKPISLIFLRWYLLILVGLKVDISTVVSDIRYTTLQNSDAWLHWVISIYVTLSHLRSKEITGIHKPCIPHSNDSSATTEYKLVCIQM